MTISLYMSEKTRAAIEAARQGDSWAATVARIVAEWAAYKAKEAQDGRSDQS